MTTRDQDVSLDATAGVLVREGSYGTQVIAVEPGGAEFIPLSERHGRPLQLFWTWTSPNMEFATIFVGVLAVAAFGLSLWEAALAIILGSGLGGLRMMASAASHSDRPSSWAAGSAGSSRACCRCAARCTGCRRWC